MSDIFEKLAMTREELQAAEDSIKGQRREDRRGDMRVCTCGHGARSHTSEGTSDYHRFARAKGLFSCRPGRQVCPCKLFMHVATVSDVRRFIARTAGTGPKHALGRGISRLLDAGGSIEFVPDLGCSKCHRTDVKITPVALTDGLVESDQPERMNYLLCWDCRNLARVASGAEPLEEPEAEAEAGVDTETGTD